MIVNQKYLNSDGRISTFLVEDWMDILNSLPNSKPSKRITTSKMGKRAIGALKEIRREDNESWYRFVRKRSITCWWETALFYRGTKITFEEMFRRADELSVSLSAIGLQAEDEIGVCVTNTPELVYVLFAANRLGIKVNLFGSNFDKSYLSEIMDEVSSKVIFISDDIYNDIRDVLRQKSFGKIVVSSLADSLTEDYKSCDEYVSWLDEYYHFENKTGDIVSELDNAVTFYDFIREGHEYTGEVIESGNLETDFLISYTSGSTKIGHPKAILHKNRSLITAGKFHDPYLSGNPKIPGLRGLAHIHPESNTDIITCISDNLIQGWSVALEPLYDSDAYIDYVFLNKPNYLNGTTSFNIQMAKMYLNSSKYFSLKMPFLFALFCVGEATSPGEEKYLNAFLKKAKAGSGVSIKGLRLPYTTVSIGGGDCEHGGIFYTLWKTLYQKLYSIKLRGESLGMLLVPYVVTTALKKNSNGQYEECDYGEMGVLVSNSYTNLSCYKNNYEATNDLIIEDNLGRKWVTNAVGGYIDRCGAVHQKGRLNTKELHGVEPYMVDDVVLENDRIIMSSSTVKVDSNYVITIQCNPNNVKNEENVLALVRESLTKSTLNLEMQKIFVRVLPPMESYPLTVSGKRSVRALEQMQMENAKPLS